MNRTRNGDRVILEDRSIWRLDPSGTARVRCWPQWSRIRVRDAGANAYWLIAEVLGRQESVLAVFGGFLSIASAAEPSDGAAIAMPRSGPTTDVMEPDL